MRFAAVRSITTMLWSPFAHRLPHEQRHLLCRRTPWLYWRYDHPLKPDTLREPSAPPRELDFLDLEDEWGRLLDQPETDD